MVDVSRAVERMERFLTDRLDDAGADGYVVGVSGGLDSAVATTLAARSVGSDAVYGLVLPGEPSSERHMADARDLCTELGIEYDQCSIAPIVDAVDDQLPFESGKRTLGNVRARARMVVEYAAANERDCLVLGASNRSEHLLGYYTKYGDAAVDVQPMQDLYKTEIPEVARALDIDETFVEKTPTAELWEGQTDEREIGVDYETIDRVLPRLIEKGETPEAIAPEVDIDRETVEHLRKMWQTSAHKRSRPPSPELR